MLSDGYMCSKGDAKEGGNMGVILMGRNGILDK